MEQQRLPSDFRPVYYHIPLFNLCLQPPYTYKGEMQIDLEVQKPAKVIWLNTKELDILDVTITHGTSLPKYERTNHGEALERVALEFPIIVMGPQAQVNIHFAGTINNSLWGFYRTQPFKYGSQTVNQGNQVFSTQFEACEARKSFPRFDEPNLKATFDI